MSTRDTPPAAGPTPTQHAIHAAKVWRGAWRSKKGGDGNPAASAALRTAEWNLDKSLSLFIASEVQA